MDIENLVIEYQRALNTIDFLGEIFKREGIDPAKYLYKRDDQKKLRKKGRINMMAKLKELNEAALNKEIKKD